MQARPTTKVEVGQRFECLLKKTLADLRPYCVWSTDDDPPEAGIDNQIVVKFGFTSEQPDFPIQVSGRLRAQNTVRVSVWKMDHSDQAGDERELLLDSPESLYRLEQILLAGFFDSCLEDDGEGGIDPILAEGIKITGIDAGRTRVSDGDYGQYRGVLSIDFATEFTWDLTAQIP